MTDPITYGKVSLRALEPKDIDLLYTWENNLEIWEVSNTKTPFSRHILSQYILDSAKDIYETKQLRLIIQNKAGLEAIGAVDLFDFDPYHLRAGIGILIHRHEDRNQGYAGDALKAFSNYCAEILGLRQLYANISADNHESIKLFEHNGFVKTGLKRDWLKIKSGWKDELFFQKILVRND